MFDAPAYQEMEWNGFFPDHFRDCRSFWHDVDYDAELCSHVPPP